MAITPREMITCPSAVIEWPAPGVKLLHGSDYLRPDLPRDLAPRHRLQHRDHPGQRPGRQLPAPTPAGEIESGDGVLRMQLEPLTASRRIHALALCDQINATQTRYPPSISSYATSHDQPRCGINEPSTLGGLQVGEETACHVTYGLPNSGNLSHALRIQHIIRI